MTTGTEPDRHCSPTYLLGALATDEAPVGFSVKLARGYAAALEDPTADLNEWTQAMATMCLSRGWQEAALAMFCSPSESQRPIYDERAREAVEHAEQEA